MVTIRSMLELVPFAIVLFAISAWRFQGKGIWNLARAVMIAPIEKQISAQLARKISASPATISVVRPTMQARASTTLAAHVASFLLDEEVPDGAAMRTNSIVKRTIPTRKVLGRINHMVGIGARSVRKGKAGRCL